MDPYDRIEISGWKRERHFRMYATFTNPTWDLLADVRITHFYRAIKSAGYPFFLSFLYAATKACHEIEEFRLRISADGEIRRYSVVHPGSTLLNDDGTFSFGYFHFTPTLDEFVRQGREVIAAAKAGPSLESRQEDLGRLYFSPIPWVSFRGFRHPFSQQANHSIPMIVFGRHEDRLGERVLPVGVTLHHGLADGYHVGLFFQRLQAMLDDPASLLAG